MIHPLSVGESLGDTKLKAGTTAGARRWKLFCGLIGTLAFGCFSLGASAQNRAPITFRGEGTFATARFARLSSQTNTFMYIIVSRDAAQQEGAGNTPNVTTQVTYGVCVFTNSTNIQICQNGSGTIANSELSGDVNYGVGGPPDELTLKFNSATEPGYQLSATQCDETDQNCSSATPMGGVIDLTWTKYDMESITTTGTSEERDYGKLTVKSVGHSAYFSASATGSMLGVVGQQLFPFPLNEIGTVRNLTFSVYFNPR